MEIYPLDWPRLSGTLSYGSPRYWELVDTEESIEIVPAKTPYGLMTGFVMLGLAVIVGTQLVLYMLPHFPDKGVATLASFGVALSFIVVCAILKSTFAKAQARGPTLMISFAKKEVCLLRENRVWPFDRVVQWEIVYGTWVRGEHGKPFLFSQEIAELQMVVDNGNGEKSAWPIVGGRGPRGSDLLLAAKSIAMKMKLPLLVTEVVGPNWPVLPKGCSGPNNS